MNRELAIQMATFSNTSVSFFVPKCNCCDEDKREDIYKTSSTEILKLQSWFLVSQVECWLHNLHVVYISRMLCVQFSRKSDHVKCWEFKLNY